MTSAEFVAELKPLLEARAALVGVAVHLTEPEEPLAPMIVLIRGRVTHEIEWETMGPQRVDAVTVPGRVWTAAATMQAAADQAATIIREIGLQVVASPPAVGTQTRKANVDSLGWLPLHSDKGDWFCDAEFAIGYESDL